MRISWPLIFLFISNIWRRRPPCPRASDSVAVWNDSVPVSHHTLGYSIKKISNQDYQLCMSTFATVHQKSRNIQGIDELLISKVRARFRCINEILFITRSVSNREFKSLIKNQLLSEFLEDKNDSNVVVNVPKKRSVLSQITCCWDFYIYLYIYFYVSAFIY